MKVQISKNLWDNMVRHIDQLEAENSRLTKLLELEQKYIEDMYQLREYSERLYAGGYRG